MKSQKCAAFATWKLNLLITQNTFTFAAQEPKNAIFVINL